MSRNIWVGRYECDFAHEDYNFRICLFEQEPLVKEIFKIYKASKCDKAVMVHFVIEFYVHFFGVPFS